LFRRPKLALSCSAEEKKVLLIGPHICRRVLKLRLIFRTVVGKLFYTITLFPYEIIEKSYGNISKG
jgi:hypothetical protein